MDQNKPTKLLICAINARYTHSSGAAAALLNYAGNDGRITALEYSINNTTDYIISGIAGEKPYAVFFPCYIWNVDIVTKIIQVLTRAYNPVIVCGGPEASYEYDGLLRAGADIIVRGEGEIPFKLLCEQMLDGSGVLRDIPSIAYVANGHIIETPHAPPLDMTDIPEGVNMPGDNKIIYYESSRGCPFSCAYCMSSIEPGGVRFLPAERVKRELNVFLAAGVRQVKFVDRTFNCDIKRAAEIWAHLIENDNGVTNFHFELAGDLLDETALSLIKTARHGLFQFEIGVQSTNVETLTAIRRKTDLKRLFGNIKSLLSYRNAHIHLDLIAGLPYEGYASFGRSFDDVYALKPDMLQLGFLKVLKGSPLRDRAEALGVTYAPFAPYEVISTPHISFDELLRLKKIEDVLSVYYNSGVFRHTVEYVVGKDGSAFAFYEDLADYYYSCGYGGVAHSKPDLYNILYDFLTKKQGKDAFITDQLIKLDYLKCENVKTLPSCVSGTTGGSKAIAAFYRCFDRAKPYAQNLGEIPSKSLYRHCNAERFDMDIPRFLETGDVIKRDCYLFFNYRLKKTGDFVFDITGETGGYNE